jgi:hypothetical protein
MRPHKSKAPEKAGYISDFVLNPFFNLSINVAVSALSCQDCTFIGPPNLFSH